MDTADIVLQAAQLVVALAGLIGLVVTIQQRTNSDNREQDDTGGSDAPRNQSSSTPNDC